LKAIREAVYLVEKSSKPLVLEILRTPEGKSFLVIHQTLKGSYVKGEEGEEKTWDLFELDAFKDVKDRKIDYNELPVDVRRALSSAFPY